MTISGVSRHRVSQPPPRRDRRLVYVAVVLAVIVVAVVAYAVWPSSSPSSTSAGTAGGSGTPNSAVAAHAGSLELNAAGSQLVSWNQTSSYCAQDGISTGDGTVATDSTGNATLTTTGKSGSCVGIISPGKYSSGVIEAYIDFPALPGKASTIANWTSFWLTNQATWPVDGELDAVEAAPLTGTNTVSWHSGANSSSVFVASTDAFHQAKLTASGPDLTPGWHTVDVVYTKGYFAVYYDGVKYTSYTSSKITGSALNILLSSTVTPKTDTAWNLIGGPEVNSDSSPATTAVKYLRVWSYK
jgi:hypothetical protein